MAPERRAATHGVALRGLVVDHVIGGHAYQFVGWGLDFDYVIVLRT